MAMTPYLERFTAFLKRVLSPMILFSLALSFYGMEATSWAQAPGQADFKPSYQPLTPAPEPAPAASATTPSAGENQKTSSTLPGTSPKPIKETPVAALPSVQAAPSAFPARLKAGQQTTPSIQQKPAAAFPGAPSGAPATLEAAATTTPGGHIAPVPNLSPFPMQSGQMQPFPMQPGAAPASRPGMFTLNFDDADVYAIVQTVFGEILRVNYVVDPRIKGRVTFRAIAPVPIEKVLPLMEVILRLNGIGIVEDGGLYRIVPISDISREPSPVSYGRDPAKIPTTGKALLQVVPITYVQSSEALKLITPFASTNAVLIDVPKGNQIIIVDTDANVKRILSLIEIFDNEKLRRRTPQVFVYQVQNSKAKDTATVLQQIFLGGKGGSTDYASLPAKTAASGSPGAMGATGIPQTQTSVSAIPAGTGAVVADTTKIISDEITNTIIILSTPEDYAVIAKAIEQLDTVPRQVVIEGMIASVTLNDNLSLGISGLLKGTYQDFSLNAGLNLGSLVDPKSLLTAGFTFSAIDAAGAVRALILALATDSRAKVLASPHILVSDNRDAKIQVGQQVPLLTSETYGAVGVAPQRNYQYKDIGIILKVKPRINEGGLVSLEISQEISTFEKVTLGGTEQLLLNKTEASTNLVVQDGQTIIIGGLIREDTSKSRSGIPFLSQIPFLGWIFGNWSDGKTRQELVILLTPTVIKNQKDAKAASAEFVDKISESSQGRIKKEELLKDKQPRSREAVIPPEVSGSTNK